MTTLVNINPYLTDPLDDMAMAVEASVDAYAIENFIAKLIFAVNKYENTLVDPRTAAKTNASWAVNGSGIVSFSIKGLCNFEGGSPTIGEPAA